MWNLRIPSHVAPRAARPCLAGAPRRVAPSLHQRQGHPARTAGSDVQGYVVKPITTEAELEAERVWLATAMTTWLDEEWTVLPEHAQLGQAAANAYVGLRRRGEDDLGAVVLWLASELLRPELSAAFRASFTDPFEVSNKLVETVMLRDGCDVCCTAPADRDRIRRVDEMVSSGSSIGSTTGSSGDDM